MPKNKAWGENSKAAEARSRKADAKKAEDERKLKAAEDAYWQDDDGKLAKKQNKKEEQEKKRLEKLQRKNESKQLEQEEAERLAKVNNQTQAKVTQAQIAAEKERREAAARKASAANKAPKPAPLVENLNRSLPVDEARTVDEALKLLTVNDSGGSGSTPDRHPERRAKAAYRAFEEARLPILKAENPSLRLSQLKQMLFDQWKKSPENPMNQEVVEFDS